MIQRRQAENSFVSPWKRARAFRLDKTARRSFRMQTTVPNKGSLPSESCRLPVAAANFSSHLLSLPIHNDESLTIMIIEFELAGQFNLID